MQEFYFPNWVNKFVVGVLLVGGLVGGYLAICLFAAVHPSTVNIGYSPEQPVPFSHAIHAGQLKMDCRYCHNTVEVAGHAAVPPTATCGNCHGKDLVKVNASGKPAILNVVHEESEKLAPIRESLKTGMPVEWIRVNNLPDFVYFNHSVHINRGVSCVSCHGRVDRMEQVTRVEPLSMKWCLDCHRNPEPHLRPAHLVTKLDWDPDDLHATFYTILDVDQDGKLTAEEARPGFNLPGQELSDDDFGKRFELADTDADGLISAEEMASGVPELSRQRLGATLRHQHGISPSQNCSTCHR